MGGSVVAVGKPMRIPWGLAGMALLVVLVEGAVARRGVDLLDIDDWAFRRAGRASTREALGKDVLCFGDSLVRFGVVPGAVGERSGLRSYNLALPGGQAPGSYFLLRRALAAGARPRAVVVDFLPTLLGKGPGHNRSHWPKLLGTAELADLAWSARDPGLFAGTALPTWLPSLDGREGLRARLVTALGGGSDTRAWANALGLRNWNRNAGAQVAPAPADPGAFGDDRVEAYGGRFLPAVACDPVNAAYVGRFLGLARRHGVRVVWVMPPLHPTLRARSERLGVGPAERAFARAWQSRDPGLTVVDARGSAPDAGAFLDPMHLAGPGAYPFSLALAEVLRHGPPPGAPGPWVDLRAFRPLPPPPSVEDLDASRLALESRGKAAR